MIPLFTVAIFMIVIFTLAAVLRRILNARQPPAESIRQRRRTRMASEFHVGQMDVSTVPDYLPAYEPKSPDGSGGPTRSLTSNDDNEEFVDAPQSIALDVEEQENCVSRVGTMERRVTFSRQVTVAGPPRVQTDVAASKLDPAAATAIRRQLRALPKASSEKPKGPVSSYILFSNDKRAQVAASPEFANVDKKDKMTRVAKQLGALWRAASDAEKKKYQALADASKDSHAKALAAYTAKRSPEDVILDSRRRALKMRLNPNKSHARVTGDPNAPKRPASAYILYMKKSGLKGGKESLKEVAAKWKGLSAATKQPFTTEAAKLLEAYKVEKAAYDKKNGVEQLRKEISKDLAKAVRVPKKKAKKVVSARRSSAPKKTKTVAKKKPVKKTAASTKKSTTLKKTAAKASSKKPVLKSAVKKVKAVAKKMVSKK
ncbi:high mobility group box 3 [Chytriomyces hyalinus]|nr:high mobility group box 3 [Chytriomyces hyalinus]